jgi:nitrogen fixation NifU-like protein
MMDELRELYQEMILDHYKSPRGCHKLDNANHSAEGYNPLCGDRVTIYLHVDGDAITDISFEGSGCAICTASSSVMTETLKGRTILDAETLFKRFHDLVTCDPTSIPDTDGLDKLAIFAGVREYPVRVKCATLPWHTLHAALEDKSGTVTTE